MKNFHKPVVLIGMMGAGKTSVGKRLADRLKWRFYDTDREIEKSSGKPLEDIFSGEGEETFRTLEREKIATLLNGENVVVALGGGGFENEKTRKTIKKRGISVWLDGNLKDLFERARQAGGRPLIENRSEKYFKTLFQARQKNYEKADIRIETTGKAPEEVTELVIEELNAHDG